MTGLLHQFLSANPPPDESEPAHWNYDDAERCCRAIRKFWHDGGYPQTTVWTDRVRQRAGRNLQLNLWVVRSNLRNGLPPHGDPRAVAKLYHGKWGGR